MNEQSEIYPTPGMTDAARKVANGSDVVFRAFEFAAEAHGAIGHKRKYTAEPYIVHPLAVAQLVQTVDHTPAMLAAAFLHDVVEDTPVTLADVEAEFGDEISRLVGWLTDVSRPEDGNRTARKHLDLLHTAKAPPEAQTIKLADLIDNTKTIAAHDPHFWRIYRREKRALLEVLREGDEGLWQRAHEYC